MRIIAGELRGRRLSAPRGTLTRPTADRVKEALFNILGPPIREVREPAVDGTGARPFRVLDLFCGSGALGLEALSRGADEALLIDEDREAVIAAEKNVAALGVSQRARVLRREVGAALIDLTGQTGQTGKLAASGTFDWVFLDPPYDHGSGREHRGGGHLDRALRLLGSRPIVAQLACAEHDARTPPADRYRLLTLADRRQWGDTAISFYRPSSLEALDDEAP